ncbi:MAG: GNAT family N-acetyltransferase [Candidatus Obscuribacterales bacterium]
MTENQDSLDGVTVLHTDQPDADHVSEVTRILNDNNQRHGYQWASLPLSVVLKDAQGKIVGGLIGSTNWGWLHVDLLSVDASLRGSGYGTKLLEVAEDIARQRGCSFAYLDTFSFQAQGFYEKHGYQVWGNLEEFPPGASRIFLKKSLSNERDDLERKF